MSTHDSRIPLHGSSDNLNSSSMFWDYLSSNPESNYQVMRLFSDLGTPYGLRHMHAWTGHSYRCVYICGVLDI